MQRRSFLAATAGLASLGAPRLLSARSRPLRVGIVGCGIVGASIAFHLAQAGAEVTVFEKTGPAKGATEKSMAWINPFTRDKHYVLLRLESLSAWRDLDVPLQLGVTWGGSITWTNIAEEAAMVLKRMSPLEGTPYPLRVLDSAAFRTISPEISYGALAAAFLATGDGHVDPVWVTYRFLDAALRFNAKVLYPCEVEGIRFDGDRIAALSTTRGNFAVDRLVIAAGVDTPRVAAMAGLDLSLKHSPGLVAHSLPMPQITRMAYDGPEKFEFKQMADGRVVGSFGKDPPDLPMHQDVRSHAMSFPDDATRDRHGKRLLGKVAEFIPATRGAVLDQVSVGFRPMPLDGLPVVGPLPGNPNVYTVVTHSGVTLAPILGRYVSAEVLTGIPENMLAPYRPDRFAAQK